MCSSDLIAEAVGVCGAERLGHGVRIVDDIVTGPDGDHRLGALASRLRDRAVPLEVCPSSNVHTGAVPAIGDHPVAVLMAAGFLVTVNTDNRLMSSTTTSGELALLAATFGLGWDDIERLTVDAAHSTFQPAEARRRLVDDVIRPGFAALRSAGANGVGGPGQPA